MYYEESIYNLVPAEKIQEEKKVRYRSMYPPNIAPTASTFGLKTSSFPNVSNFNGDINLPKGAHPLKQAFGTMGKPNGN